MNEPGLDALARYACEGCGCDVTADRTITGSLRWVDTRGSSLCPAWTQTFHAPNVIALPIVDPQTIVDVLTGLDPGVDKLGEVGPFVDALRDGIAGRHPADTPTPLPFGALVNVGVFAVALASVAADAEEALRAIQAASNNPDQPGETQRLADIDQIVDAALHSFDRP